jgi:YD repeat-containing protein
MDPSTSGTGGLVLGKAAAASDPLQGGSTVPPGYSDGGFAVQDGHGRVEPRNRHLLLSWALPTSSPADFPIVLTYYGDSTDQQFGGGWTASFQRYAEGHGSGPFTINTPATMYGYTEVGGGPSYVPIPPANNALSGSSASGWVETQADGTQFVYDNQGVPRTVRNNAGVRWTLSWDSGFNIVEHIDGPFGRRTTIAYDASASRTPAAGSRRWWWRSWAAGRSLSCRGS